MKISLEGAERVLARHLCVRQNPRNNRADTAGNLDGINATVESAVFFDGSARYTRARELWKMPWHRAFDVTNYSRISFPAWLN